MSHSAMVLQRDIGTSQFTKNVSHTSAMLSHGALKG